MSESAGSESAGHGPASRDDPERTGPTGTGPIAVPRLPFTRRHLVVVAVLLVVAAVVAGTAVLRARPVALATGTTETSVGPATPAPSPAGSSTPAPAMIVVHVLGEVRKPGVVELTEGARVQDALAAADGLTRAAVPGEINLAQRLVDGQQVVVADRAEDSGVRESSGQDPKSGRTGGGGTTTGDQLDLNAASEAQLLELPGVGPVTAGHIIAWRDENGRFTRVEELQEVTGIGPKTFAQLAPLVRV